MGGVSEELANQLVLHNEAKCAHMRIRNLVPKQVRVILGLEEHRERNPQGT
jgi:hypothetical protein